MSASYQNHVPKREAVDILSPGIRARRSDTLSPNTSISWLF